MLTALTTTVCSSYLALVDNDASTDRHADDIHSWYIALAADHPGYKFEHYDAGLRHKWAATALHLDCHPWCVVTGDPHEFRRHLPSG